MKEKKLKNSTKLFLVISNYVNILTVSGIMLFSGFSKIYDVYNFIASLSYYKYIPSFLHHIIGFTVPVIEVGVGIIIWIKPLRRLALITYQILIIMFIVILLSHIGEYMPLGCGCFGSSSGEFITFHTIFRDFLLLLPAWVYFLINRWSR